MSLFNKKQYYPIGIDFGSNYLKMVQLCEENEVLGLCDAAMIQVPSEMETGSGQWQRWAADAVKASLNSGKFKNRKIVAGISADELFIDYLKIPQVSEANLEEHVRKNIKSKLPYDVNEAMLKYVASSGNDAGEIDVVVIAAEKLKVERHLAIFEAAKVEVAGMSVWPFAMSRAFVKFFAKRESDNEKVVVLIDVGSRHSNVVITRHEELLFARSIKFGLKNIEEGQDTQLLITELKACLRYFEDAYKGEEIARLIFFSGNSANANVCRAIASLAKEMKIVAQVGDCLGAVESTVEGGLSFDRRGCNVDWSVAFGLSLAV